MAEQLADGDGSPDAVLKRPQDSPVYQHFRALRASLLADFTRAGGLKHGPMSGRLRQRFLADFLNSHLPANYRIASGKVVDSLLATSLEQDIVVYRYDIPKLNVGEFDYFFNEGVLATIEVKSTLNRREIAKAFDNARSVRTQRRVRQESRIEALTGKRDSFLDHPSTI